MAEILEAVDISRSRYFVSEDNRYLTDSIEKAFSYIPRICSCRRIEKDHPEIKQLNYIKGIVRNRCNYFNPSQAAQIVQKAYNLGADIEYLTELAKLCRHWSGWKSSMHELVEELETDL